MRKGAPVTTAAAAAAAPPRALPSSPVPAWLLVVLVTGLGLFLRLYQIGAEGLFPDEGISIEHARGRHIDTVRPLYFLLLRGWLRFGDSIGFLRLPAALLGAATVPLVYLLGQKLFSARAGLIAALLVAVSPVHLNHSQEIRMYSQVTFFAVASFLSFYALLQRGRARAFIAYGLYTVGALLTQPISLFVVAAQNLYLVAWWRRHRRLATWWLLSQAAVLLLALPFVGEMTNQAAAFAQDWASGQARPTLRTAVQLVGDLSFWSRNEVFLEFGAAAYFVYYAVLLTALLLLAAAPLLMRGYEPQVTLLLAWLAVPLVCGFVLSNTIVHIWQVRYLIYVLPAYALLLAFGVDRLIDRGFARPAWAAVAAVILAGLALDVSYYIRPMRADWEGAMAYIRERRQPGDGIGVYADQVAPAFRYYYEREVLRRGSGTEPAPSREDADWAPLLLQPRVFRDLTPEELRRLLASLPPNRPRYWLFLMHHGHRGGESLKRFVEEQYEVLDRPSFRNIEMILFRPRPNARLSTGTVQQKTPSG